MEFREKQKKAMEALTWFLQAFKEDNEEYWSPKTGRPDWVTDLIIAATTVEGLGRIYVNDHFRTRFTVESLQYFADPSYEKQEEIVPISSDTGYRSLQWAASHHARCDALFVLESQTDYGSLQALLEEAMTNELKEVFLSISTFLEEYKWT